MIQNFKHKGLEDFFYDGTVKGIVPKHAKRISGLLDRLNTAHEIKDMNFAGAGLHPLKGNLVGFYALKVSGNWRVIFRFDNGNAYDIDYLDYH